MRSIFLGYPMLVSVSLLVRVLQFLWLMFSKIVIDHFLIESISPGQKSKWLQWLCDKKALLKIIRNHNRFFALVEAFQKILKRYYWQLFAILEFQVVHWSPNYYPTVGATLYSSRSICLVILSPLVHAQKVDLNSILFLLQLQPG